MIDLEIQSLNEALRLANEEVRQLRQQCDELLASSRSPRSPNHIAQHRIDQPGDMDAHITRAIGEMPPPGLSLPTEVEMLTEEAAKNALSVGGSVQFCDVCIHLLTASRPSFTHYLCLYLASRRALHQLTVPRPQDQVPSLTFNAH